MAKLGSITVNEIEIAEVNATPIGDATMDLATGSLAVLTDGTQMWHKNATGVNGWQPIGNKSYVGLANVDNTSDANKPVSTAQQTALNAKSNLVGSNSFTGGTQTLTPTNSTDTAIAVTQGRVLIGSSTAQDITGLSVFPPFQILGTASTQMVVGQYSADTIPAVVNMIKSRGALNAQGLLSNNDEIGRLQFRGSDGANFQAAASIRAAVDGVAAAGSMPGRLSLQTTPSGSVTPVERVLINSNGEVTIGSPTGAALTNNLLSVNGTVNSYFQSNVQNLSNGTTASGDIIVTGDTGTDTTNYLDMGVNSSGWNDPTFTINGPGDGYLYKADGDLSIGTSTANNLILFTGGTLAANERARINSTGQMIVGGITPNAASKLQIDSTTQGFLQPRMTSAQRLAISTPPAGLTVYDTNLNTICTYTGVFWSFEYNVNTTAIQTSTSTTYANITELVTQSLEPGLYALRLRGIMQSTALGTGVGLRIQASGATLSTININWNFSQAAAGTDKNFEYNQIAAADNVTSASVVTANANFPVSADGVFRVTASGAVAIQIRSENGGTGVSIRPDSVLIVKKIG